MQIINNEKNYSSVNTGSVCLVQRVFELKNMTWEEAEEELKLADYVLLPIGSNEQHSLHLPLKTDTAMTYEITKKIVHRASPDLRIVVAPKLSYGISEHHMHFAGTISLKEETLLALVSDICTSLQKHQVKNIILLNGHGGNRALLEIGATQLQTKLDANILLINWWVLASDIIKKTVKSKTWGHSCEVETSLAMHLIPNVVKVKKIQTPSVTPNNIDLSPLGYEERFSPSPVRYWEELTNTGSLGDPRQASSDFGLQLVNVISERLVYSLIRFKHNNLTDFPS
jgi:creatinine amidohydrolase